MGKFLAKNSKHDGFSAVELLITLFIAAAFLLAGYQLFNVVISSGGDARAESRAGNVAYEYLRQYIDTTTTNPCSPATPLTNQPITADGLELAFVTVSISCPKSAVPALSKVEAVITYNTPVRTVRYATYIDKSKGASPIVDVTSGLVGRWRLNGNGNADVGPNATLNGATAAANRSGISNMAYAFTGSGSQNAQVASNFGITNNNFTMAAWVNVPAVSGGEFIKLGGSGNGYGVGIGSGNFDITDPGSKIILLIEGIRWIDTGITLGTGWRHVAVAYNTSGKPRLYKDGVLVYSDEGTNGSALTNNETNFGGQAGHPNRTMSGSIDDVRIYNRALTPAEVMQIYNAGPF